MCKNIFLLTLLIFFLGCIHAQPIQLFGYAQEINGGARLLDDNLPGNRSNANDLTNSRYFIFAEIKKGGTVLVEQVWIKGHRYDFKVDTVKKLPFVFNTSNGGEMIMRDTLVRSSKELIIQLKDLVRTGKPGGGRSIVTKNEVVIFFRYRNRQQAIALKKLKKLRPLFTQ